MLIYDFFFPNIIATNSEERKMITILIKKKYSSQRDDVHSVKLTTYTQCCIVGDRRGTFIILQ